MHMAPYQKRFLPLLLLLSLCLLAGCGLSPAEESGGSSGPGLPGSLQELISPTRTVTLRAGEFPADTTELTAVITADEIELLDGFSQLQRVNFSGSRCYDEILQWSAAHPQVDVSYTVALPGGAVADQDTQVVDLSGLDDAGLQEARPLLAYLPALQNVSLGSAPSADTALEYLRSFPDVHFDFSFTVNGQEHSLAETSLDLSEADAAEAEAWLSWMPFMSQLRSVQLGSGDGEDSRIPWTTIAAMEKACPNARFDYAFQLYGVNFDLHSRDMNLNHLQIDDEGALVKEITACMPELRYLDMDFCGVSDDAMASIRDSLPGVDVVWRIWFGTGYTVRTNETRILASNPGKGGNFTRENTYPLRFCTKVRYLDLGHNDTMEDISFVSYMPDLEVAVLAMGAYSDLRPLADCPKLEYLELQTSAVSDLRPLSGLKNLRHLNLCYNFTLMDITPLYELTGLERLWLGCLCPIPAEQIATFKRLVPNCEVNTTTVDPTEEGWRYLGHDEYGLTIVAPRYILLTEQMRYGDAPYSYAYIENDPLYGYRWT